MSRRVGLLSLILAGAAATAPAAPPPSPAAAGEARRQIEALRRTLESAVSRAAGAGRLSARAAGRGVYHLPGYGAMLVLLPRALPTRSVIVLRPDRAPRATRRAPPLVAVTPDPPDTPEPPDPNGFMTIDLGELERELQAQMAVQAKAMRELERYQRHRARAQDQDVRREIEAIEQQVELMREEADRVRAMAEREILVHLGRVEPPLAPIAPAPPAPARPLAPPLTELPPPPPWRFWFETQDDREARRPEEVVASVRDALAAGLESHRGSLTALRAEEWVTVAVDFVPTLAGRPTRTLQARVRVKDMRERRAGSLAADAFRKCIEFQEY